VLLAKPGGMLDGKFISEHAHIERFFLSVGLFGAAIIQAEKI
jgi:hypothetical protein